MHSSYALLVLTALVGSAVSQQKPTWFLYDQDESLPFSERKAVCEEVYPDEKDNASTGRILIPADSPHAEICIQFPPIADKGLAGGWRHDTGTKGGCANGCCEFKPPLKNSPDLKYPTWFEADDCAAVPAELINGPVLFQGTNGEAKSICLMKEDGSFELQTGETKDCGGKCCPLVL